ncbi:MAG TPA: hypothetical protein VJH94_00110 [Candidatus Paceibacterota bacterium]
MDTSKFSLQYALAVIGAAVPHLSFKHLDHYLFRAWTEDIGEEVVTLKIVPEQVLMDGSLSCDDFVYGIPVTLSSIQRSGSHIALKVSYTQLLLRRVGDGTNLERGRWFFQTMEFERPPNDHIRWAFSCTNSVIRRITDESFLKMMPSEYPEKFWEHIRRWAEDSMKVREVALDSLKYLHGNTVKEEVKERAIACGVPVPVST